MDITGKITQILPVQEFTSKKDGSVYHKYAFVLETQEQFPKKVCFTCFGDDKWAQLKITLYESYNVQFDLTSREVNGRWFTEASCWRAVQLGQPQTNVTTQPHPHNRKPPQMSMPTPQEPPQQPAIKDLPF